MLKKMNSKLEALFEETPELAASAEYNLNETQKKFQILKSFNNHKKSPNFVLGADDVITNSRGQEDIASSIGRNNERLKDLGSKLKSPLFDDTTLCQQDRFINVKNTKRE